MTNIRNRVLINIALSTLFATRRTFRAVAFFDNALIPTDVRKLVVTANEFSDIVGTSGELYEACLRYFQNGNVAGTPYDLYLGRLIEAASSPFWTAGDWETSYLVYQAVSDGAYAVSIDGGTTWDNVPGNDFESCNSFDDVLDVLNATLDGITPVNVPNLNLATWSVDALGRLTLTMSATGSTAAQPTIIAGTGGTNLAISTYFDAANGTAHPGFDAMTLLESYESFKLLEDDFWAVFVRGGDDTELLALAQQIETEERFIAMFEDSSTATNPASTSDLASQADALGLKRCSVTFTYAGSYPEIAQFGASIAADEGSTAFGFMDLANELDSGQALYNYRLTPTQESALEAKNYNWIETIADRKSAFPGRSVAGQEIRLLLGRDWMAAEMQARIYAARIDQRILGFDNQSLAVYEQEILDVLEEAKSRRIIQSYTTNIPDEDSFSAADKATHHVIIENVFDAEVVTDGWRYTFSGNLALDI